MKLLSVVGRLLRRGHNDSRAKCEFCGKLSPKREMFHDKIYGWFCDEEEGNKFWDEGQW
jgi:hypothetical protein